MAYLNQAGLGVSNQYGTRDTGVSIGTDHTRNAKHELNVEFTAQEMAQGGNFFLPPYVIPKGARFVSAYLTVHTPITVSASVSLGGTAPATNGITLTAGQLGAAADTIADVSSALTGTWATASALGTTADEKVTYLGGGTITRNTGKVTLVLTYIYKNRLHSYKAGTV